VPKQLSRAETASQLLFSSQLMKTANWFNPKRLFVVVSAERVVE
jgi:hypothetical protein